MVQGSTLAKWRAIVARHDSSGMTIKEFANSEGLNPRTLSWWRWRIRRKEDEVPSAVAFAELDVQPDEPTVVLVLDNLEAHIVVDGDTDLELLRDVVVALS